MKLSPAVANLQETISAVKWLEVVVTGWEEISLAASFVEYPEKWNLFIGIS